MKNCSDELLLHNVYPKTFPNILIYVIIYFHMRPAVHARHDQLKSHQEQVPSNGSHVKSISQVLGSNDEDCTRRRLAMLEIVYIQRT